MARECQARKMLEGNKAYSYPAAVNDLLASGVTGMHRIRCGHVAPGSTELTAYDAEARKNAGSPVGRHASGFRCQNPRDCPGMDIPGRMTGMMTWMVPLAVKGKITPDGFMVAPECVLPEGA